MTSQKLWVNFTHSSMMAVLGKHNSKQTKTQHVLEKLTEKLKIINYGMTACENEYSN